MKMKHKLQLRNLALSLVLALAMVAGALPGVAQKAHAAEEVTYLDANGQEQSVTEYTESISNGNLESGWYVVKKGEEGEDELELSKISIRDDSDVKLILCDGAKLTIKNEWEYPLSIESGRLTVYAQSAGDNMGALDVIANGEGNNYGIFVHSGDITINGGNINTNGQRGIDASVSDITINGGNVNTEGVRGINANESNITINGGTVNVKGNDGIDNFDGNLTINDGTVTIIGTDSAINGSVINRIAGTGWTDTEGTQGMADIEVSETGQSLSYKKVQFPAVEPVNVELNAGTDHGALFTDEVLADMVSQTDGFASATREGDIITIGVTNTSMTEYELLRTLDEYIVTKLFAPPAGPRHNDEVFITTAPQSVDKYSKNSELSADIKAKKENPTVIEEGFTAYMLWATKYSEEITLTAKAPVAGGDPKDYLPETPEGIVLYEITLPPDVPEGTPEPPKFNYWTTNTTEPFTADPMEGTFAAGDEYACVATPDIDPESANWARYLDPDISIKVDNVTDEVVGKRYGNPSVSYKVTVAKVDVTGITLNKDKLTLEKEADETLEATVAPTDASKKTVTWKSSDEDVATVDENGKVTAVAVGTATITATATNGTEATTDDKTATCTVTVTGKSFNITKSEMENGSVTVKVGDAEATKAKEGETVTLVVEPAEGYQLKELQAVYLGMAILDLTEVTEGEEYTFTMPDNDVTVSAKFEKKPVTVKIDVGAGHAALFTSDVLNEIKSEFELTAVTINGNIIKLEGVNPSTTEYDMWLAIADFVNDLVEPADFMHNKEWFRDPAYKPIDEYATSSDLYNDIYDETHESTQVSDNLTYYLFWAKPYEKLEIDNGNPTCGNEMWKAFPTVPDGFMVDPEDSVWRDENGERVGTFEGGKTYTFSGRIYLRSYGALWKYFLDEDNFTLTVKDGKDLEYSLNGDRIKLSYKATADHDWDEGTVTKQPTTTAEGVKTFKCKHFDTCGGTKTEAIPKLKPASTVKPVLVAKGIASGKKAVNISWNKVSGADRYVVYFAKCSVKGKEYRLKKVKTVNAKTLKFSKGGLAKNTAYKFCVVAQKKSGKTYKTVAKSNVGHFLTGNYRGKYTNPKSLKLSKTSMTIKKGKSASIKASVTKVYSSKKLATAHAAAYRYISNNPTVATVNAKGKVTAKKKGTATIYVQTINGIWKTCKVTVK